MGTISVRPRTFHPGMLCTTSVQLYCQSGLLLFQIAIRLNFYLTKCRRAKCDEINQMSFALLQPTYSHWKTTRTFPPGTPNGLHVSALTLHYSTKFMINILLSSRKIFWLLLSHILLSSEVNYSGIRLLSILPFSFPIFFLVSRQYSVFCPRRILPWCIWIETPHWILSSY
jgi:hypothetical protein